jgi:hypothetical protein
MTAAHAMGWAEPEPLGQDIGDPILSAAPHPGWFPAYHELLGIVGDLLSARTVPFVIPESRLLAFSKGEHARLVTHAEHGMVTIGLERMGS